MGSSITVRHAWTLASLRVLPGCSHCKHCAVISIVANVNTNAQTLASPQALRSLLALPHHMGSSVAMSIAWMLAAPFPIHARSRPCSCVHKHV